MSILNLDGCNDAWSQVILNKTNKINTWAISWYATIFKQNGLCLSPTQTFVENIGHDNSGVHCGDTISYKNTVSTNKNIVFNSQLEENSIALLKIQEFYKKEEKTLFQKIQNRALNIFGVKK